MTAAKLASTTNTATVNRKKKYIEEMYFGPLFALVGKIFLSKVLETVLKTTVCKVEISTGRRKHFQQDKVFLSRALLSNREQHFLSCPDYSVWRQVSTMGFFFESILVSLGESGLNFEQRIHVYSWRYIGLCLLISNE